MKSDKGPTIKLLKKETPEEDNEYDNEEEEVKEKPKPAGKIPVVIDAFSNPSILKKLVIALSVIIIVVCVGFMIYQFYSKGAQRKLDICQQEKMASYKKQIDEYEERTDTLSNENNELTTRLSTLQSEYDKLVEVNRKLAEYEQKPQTVFRTTPKKTQKKQQVVESQDENDNEYTVEHPQFDDVPISKNKKKINPQQALKAHINENAKKAYDKKQSAIRSQMDDEQDVLEEQERGQMEIQKELGLGREINDAKLMELAEEQEAIQDVNTDDVVEIDESLIA